MDNILRFQAAVKESELDALLITSMANRFYATGFRSSAGEIIVTADETVLYIDARYFEEASAKIKTARVEKLIDRSKSFEVIGDYLKKKGIKTLGVEEQLLNYGQYKTYETNLPVELRPGQKIIQDLRAVKSPEELQMLIDAQRIAEKAFLATVPLITREMTEKDLYREFFCQILKAGADDKAFGPIVVSGTHSSVPHGQADNRKLSDGFLTLDFGAKLNGYNSDTTRTLCIGEPTKEMEKVYYTVLEAQETAIKAAKPGMTGRELDGVARKVIEDAGYGEYFSHSLSHGLGIDVHETPNCSPTADNILPVGAVISMEPGIYIPGRFGVRIEDVIYITEDGCLDITDLPKELTVICK